MQATLENRRKVVKKSLRNVLKGRTKLRKD
jgi:hypothetical protein